MVYPPAGNESLFDAIASSLQCEYLSDLKRKYSVFQIREVISKLNEDDFELREWNDAIHYFKGVERTFRTAKEAKDYLLEV